MLDILTSGGVPFCDHVSRRQAMQIGGLGSLGLGLPHLLQSEAQAKPSESDQAVHKTFGQAKRVIMFFMWGGPAHQDTWDLKPDGPVETRGEFQPIGTTVPGMHISEHFPLIAQQAEKLAIVRSVGQEDNNHSTGAHAGLTGRKHELKAENFAASQNDFPHYGSVLSKLRRTADGLPPFVALPEVIATTAGKVTPGQDGGLLGRKYDPFQINEHPDRLDFSIGSLQLPDGLNNRRMQSRRHLLQQIDRVARIAERSQAAEAMGDFYQQALNMVLSPQARRAFDLVSVPEAERWRYGWHTFGQSTLLARRLIEAGVQLVTVYWHREKKTVDSTWDTHWLNFQELKNRLMPSVDRPIAALLQDLEDRGLLDETLIIWNSEFGRTPRINKRAGRDHWGPCNSVVMAGGGVPGGQVYGASDRKAAYPTENKVTQDDIAATVYHLLGYHPETRIRDRLNRPHPVALGEPIYDLLGDQSHPEPQPTPEPPPQPQYGPFYKMMIERGVRFLCCDLGNSAGEKEWTLTGWSAPQGSAEDRHRNLGDKPGRIKYEGIFRGHFDYAFAVLRLAKAKPIDELSLSVNGRAIPVPQELRDAGEQTVWQIPLPKGMIPSMNSLEVTLQAPGWQVRDFALSGEKIRELYLERLSVA